MLLYNVTGGIDKNAEYEWLQYMKQTHIPAVMKTGMFTSFKFFKILHDQGEDTTSYSVQYFAPYIEQVQQYLEVYAPALVEEHRQKFINKHVVFQTLLEEV